VTDNQGWQPPASSTPGPGGASPWATPAAPQAAPQQIPAWQQQQQSAPGWTPPPKPGLIPLHPLSFGTIIGSSFRVMRRNPAPTLGMSVLLYGFVTIVYAALMGLLFTQVLMRLSSASVDDQSDILSGGVGLFVLAALVPTSLALVATAFLQGLISLEVSRATLGEKLKTRGLWRLAKGRLGTMALWALVLTGAIIVFVVIALIATSLIFVAGATSATGGDGVLSVLAGFGLTMAIILGFVVVGSWLGIKTALVPSVIVLERLSLWQSVRRSWQLTKGNFWRTFGTQLLIGVIINTASSIITTPISLIFGIVIGVTNPTADPETTAGAYIVLALVSGILTILTGAIGLVMTSASLALIYIDIRMRKEGLDLELLRYVEAKQNGTTSVENPYLRLQGGPAYAAQPGSPWA
jgi:hypothetical protein